MANGHYELTRYKFELPNGSFEWRTRQVWIPDPPRRPKPVPKKKPVVTASSRALQLARQNEAKARLAAAEAKAREMEKARVRAKALAYQELREKQIQRARGLLPGKPVVVRPMVKPEPPKGPGATSLTERQELDMEKRMMREAAARAAAEAARQKAKRDALIKNGAYEFLLPSGKTETRYHDQKGDAQYGKDVEAQLRLEAAAAKASGKVDTDYLEKLSKVYEKHADAVYKKYEKLVAQLNAALDANKMERAKKLYYSAEFKAAQAEFVRLYGKGQNPLKDGSYSQFQSGFDEIAMSQREWWKRQMKAQLQTQLQTLVERGGPPTGENAAYQKQLQAQLDAFNGKTGVVSVFDPKTGKNILRHRTLEEELQHQQALIVMEREKQAAIRNQTEIMRKKDMMLNGQVEYKNTVVNQADLPLIQTWERLVAQNPSIMPAGGFRRPEQVQGAVNLLLGEWERQNQRPPSRSRTGDLSAFESWKRRRDAYEKYVYGFFGNTPPEWWDRVLGAPGVSHAFALLQAGNSAIGAAGRVISKSLTGSSTLGVDKLDFDKAPASYKAAIKKAEAEFLAKNGYTYRWQQGVAVAVERARADWLNSAEGKKWATEQRALQRSTSEAEDTEFKERFYGGNTNALPQIAKDPGEALRVLNEYGQAPFQNDGANLLFNLLADPTNAIPLKFTTYLARGKYAMEAAQAAKGLTKPTAQAAAAMRTFLAVDEGTLKKMMEGQRLLKELKVEGMSLERLVDIYRADTAGLSKLSEKKSVLNDILRKAGFLPREIPEAHLFNLVEDLAVGMAEKRGLHLLTEVEKQAKKTEDLIKKAEAEAKAAEASLRADHAVVQSSRAIAAKRNASAREVLQTQRKAAAAPKPVVPKPEPAPRATFARFRTDARGNAAPPAGFKEEPGFVYRVVNEGRVGSDWREGEFASRKLQTVYVTDVDRSIILRVKESAGFDQAKAGLNASDNVTSRQVISAHDVEVLTADGNWVPATLGSQTPEPRIAAEAAGRPPFNDPFTGEPRPFVDAYRAGIDIGGDYSPVPGQKIYHGSRADDIRTFVDADGNLHLHPSENFGGKTQGVSFTESKATAHDYATRTGSPSRKTTGLIFEIDADAMAPRSLFIENAEEVATRGGYDVVIPAGKWRFESLPGNKSLEDYRRDTAKALRDGDDEALANWFLANTESGELVESARGFEDPSSILAQGNLIDEPLISDEITRRVQTDSGLDALADMFYKVEAEGGYFIGWGSVEEYRKLLLKYRSRPSISPEVPDALRTFRLRVDADMARERVRGVAPDPTGPIPNHADDPLAPIDMPTLSEQDWLRKEKFRAHTVLTSKVSTAAQKNAARSRIKLIEHAEEAIRGERRSAHHIKLVLKAHGADAKQAIPPNMISPLALSGYDASVEMVRSLWRRLQTTPVGPVEGGTSGIIVKGKRTDHIPKHVYDEVEAKVSAYIRAARGGWRNELLTKRKQKGGGPPELQLGDEPPVPIAGRMTDKDPLVLKAKEEALADYARETGTKISVEAYDEARHVLWRSFVQNRSARYLLLKARKYRLLHKDVSLEDAFLHVRKLEAEKESLRQLQVVAREMPDFKPDEVMAEFLRRYSDDGILYHPAKPLSDFQRSTIENYIKDITGFDQLDDRMSGFLQSANRPPLHNKELTKGFLTRIGAWSPRKSELFLKDATSWSVQEEARYWLVNYGEIPEWADELALVRGNKAFFRNDGLHYAQLQAWGVFNRSADLAMRASGKTAKEIEAAQLEAGRRSLAQQRKYAIERYGRLVSKDGKTLDEMPWLMNDTEYRRYMARDLGEALPENFIQNTDELDEIIELAQKVMDPLFEKYIGSKAVDGVVDYTDLLRFVSEVQATLLANPKWAKRHRDIFGTALNGWAWFNRWLVFSNPSFLVTNVIDAPLKTAYYRFTRRGLFSVDLARASADAQAGAAALTPASLGYDTTSAMYRVKQASVKSRLTDPRGYSDMERATDRALALVDGTGAIFPEIAGRVELAHQMTLARQIYASFYDEAILQLGKEGITGAKANELADAFAKNKASKEARHMWPTAGDGPIERLWNRVVPFASYSLRNKVMFISEAVGHPALINYVNAVGRYIEQENLKNWEDDPKTAGFEMPEHLRRRIELPWAPGYYLDLSTFSDASRGLKPLFTEDRETTALGFASDWITLVKPGPQAGIYALMNAFNIAQKTGWVLGPNGWERQTTPWLEPWSKDAADATSVFWMLDVLKNAEKFAVGGFTGDEATMLLGQVLFFNGIATYDRGAVLNSYYFTLKEKSPDDARKWLGTPDGKALIDWWETRVKNPLAVKDAFTQMEKNAIDPSPWFHDQTKDFQQKVRDARDLIERIRDGFAAELSQLTPGTSAYREMKARMYIAINNVYLNTPELMQTEVWAKSPAEWANQLSDWQTDKLMDDFMALTRQRPARADYKDSKTYNLAVEEWEHQKQLFLQSYPQVANRLNAGRTALDRVREKMDKEWDAILTRIASRNEAIDAAKATIAKSGRDSAAGEKAQDFLDRAYLQNELDFSLLERDYAATYFTQDDHDYMAENKKTLLQRATTLIDFDRTRYEKALREGTLDEFIRKEEYGKKLREAIAYAKGNDPFGEFDGKRWGAYMAAHPDLQKQYFAENPGSEQRFKDGARYFNGITALWKRAGGDPAAWVRLLKQDPWLLRQYFARNPGKEAQWARTDKYIKYISTWGRLIGAGKFDAANAAWDALPQWVKDEYYKKHPERRKQAAQTAKYLGYMDKWVKLFEAGDKDGAMKYFNSLPDWAKERYFQKHPDKRAKFALDAKMSVLLAEYFAGEKNERAAYLAAHPDLAAWLAKNSPSKAGERYAILAAYQAIPKGEAWLRRVFREKYPEVFGQEEAGVRRLRSVYDSLSRHPEVTDEFEKWVKVIMETYAEMLKHAPRPASANVELFRDVPDRFRKPSLSAAEANRYSRSHSYAIRNSS